MAALSQLLEVAAVHHRKGELQQAARGYLAVLERDPEHADALQLLGMVAHRLGQTASGLELVERALRADKRHEVAHANRAILLRALDRAEEAEAAGRAALRLRPDFARPALLLAELSLERGAEAEARRVLESTLRQNPEHPGLRRSLAHLQLRHARERLATGQPGEALGLLRAANTLSPEAPDREAWLLLTDILTQLADPPADLGPLLVDAFGQAHLDLQRLERAARAVMDQLPGVQDLPEGPDPAQLEALASALEDQPLFHQWLRCTVVASPAWEERLVALRDHLLLQAQGGSPVPLRLAVSLAMQGWITEGAWASGTWKASLALPEGAVGNVLRALLGRPLELPPEAHPELEALLEQQRRQPEAEGRLAASLPSLGVSEDLVSQAVAAQYEANPYPRLVHVHQRSPRPLAELLEGVLSAERLQEMPAQPRVLVAGGGTGQHPLSTATRIAGAQVTAIDLSRASLGRAAREAQARGIDNLRFLQADLLQLEALEGGPFDLIESGGVLHHLADPVAGFRALLPHLAPHGLLRIGLYSERGRGDVVAARALARERAWQDSPEGIRQARREILALPVSHPARGLVHSFDFYSLSGARDLFLHSQEHRFTPLGLAALLEGLELEFLGFEHGQTRVTRLYAERWPDDPGQRDLTRWDALEQEHPRIFSGMLQFWCAPRSPGSVEPG